VRGLFLHFKFSFFFLFLFGVGVVFFRVCVCVCLCVCAFVRVCINNGLFLFNRKPGHYGDGNRPGFPKERLVVGKFASASSSHSPLSAMILPTHQQKEDVATLNMLPDFIVNAYRPGTSCYLP
jgi:hypothetical protein